MPKNTPPTAPMHARIAFTAEHEYFSSLCCPKCGNRQMAGDPPYVDDNPCQHLLFIWWDFAGSFFYQSADLEARRNALPDGDTHQDWQDPSAEWLQSLGYGPSTLMLEVHEPNTGNGPCYAVWAWDLGA